MSWSADILIVGGGIIGLTAAIRLREAGATVAVYDRGEFGREASWAGAGILPPGNPDRAESPIDRLRAIGAVEFPKFAAQLFDSTGIDTGYRVNGGIEFLTDEDAYAVDLWTREGIIFERIDDRRVSNATAYLLPGMAQVRNPWHLRALLAFAETLGIQLVPHSGIEGWQFHQNRVAGVRLANGGLVEAGQYLIAAGPWSERLLVALNCRPGVHPVRGQILLLNANGIAGPTLIAGKRYLVPRGDGLVLAGSTEEPEAGFAKHTTETGLKELRDFANDMLPALRTARVERSWAGLRPGSPDGLPFIGRVPGQERVFAAVGHARAGVQLSPGTARFLVELMLDRKTIVPPEVFALDRVSDKSTRPTFRS
jgi:glycine oxidase